jgi:hypothetical protein
MQRALTGQGSAGTPGEGRGAARATVAEHRSRRGTRPRRALAAGVVAAGALGICAIGAVPVSSAAAPHGAAPGERSAPASGSTTPRTRAPAAAPTPRQSATAEAKALLASLVLPAGAQPATALPPSLDRPFSSFDTTQQVHLVRRLALAHTAPAALLAFLESHVPAGTVDSGRGTSSGAGGTATWSVTFTPRHLAPDVDEATLAVTLAASGAGSALRADAEVVYQFPHPADAAVPAGVGGATVWRTVLGAGGETRRVQLHAGALLSLVVAAFDATPVAVPGPVSCPAGFGVELHLSFPGTATSPPISAAENNCSFIAVTISGRPDLRLRDLPGTWSGRLAELLARALGYHGDAVWQTGEHAHPLPQPRGRAGRDTPQP